MLDGNLLFIGAVFLLAGLIKGVIGLGLPTVSMGLLAIVMPPLQAAAILVLPSFLTNVWQMLAGPSLPTVAHASGCVPWHLGGSRTDDRSLCQVRWRSAGRGAHRLCAYRFPFKADDRRRRSGNLARTRDRRGYGAYYR